MKVAEKEYQKKSWFVARHTESEHIFKWTGDETRFN